MTPSQFARLFERLAATAPATQFLGESVVGAVAEASIKRTYGDASKLRDLEQSTQEERERLGYAPNDPLRRTGELLADSIKTEHAPGEVVVGTEEPVAAYQEFGFFNVRARRFVEARPANAIGAADAMPEVEAVIVATVKAIATGRDSDLLRHAVAQRVTTSVSAVGEDVA